MADLKTLQVSADNIARRAFDLGQSVAPEMQSVIRLIEDLAYVVKALADNSSSIATEKKDG